MNASLVEAQVQAPAELEDLSRVLKEGRAIGNDIIAASGRRATAALKKATKSKGSNVRYEPRGWTIGGSVD